MKRSCRFPAPYPPLAKGGWGGFGLLLLTLTALLVLQFSAVAVFAQSLPSRHSGESRNPELFKNTASKATLKALEAKLAAWDVEDVWPEVMQALAAHPQDADILEIAAHIAYHRGDYPEAIALIKKSLATGGENEGRKGLAGFFEETLIVLKPYKRYESPHFIIHLEEKQDGILIDYLIDALEKTESVMALKYGYRPKEKVRVELFPDTKAFYRGSALSVRDIEVTGAVGLAKFNKLQFLSPRALVHGYRWLDAISHEYMHYLIMKLASNKAPIWFHEGLAKYEETSWRSGPSYLTPVSQTLLARALMNNALIGFERMEPSLLRLETPEEVQLAYAQAASAIEFIILSSGQEGLKKIMARMAKSETSGAGESIQEVLGLTLPQFEKNWRDFLAAKSLRPLDSAAVRPYRVKEGGADEGSMDLREIKSLVGRNRAYLGDKLKESGRMRAAVLEYKRALKETGDSVPIMNRLSAALMGLGQHKEALEVLQRTLALDPDHPTPYAQIGQIYGRLNNFREAKGAFEGAIQINPFNPAVHAGLADAYAMLGDKEASARERTIAEKLQKMR